MIAQSKALTTASFAVQKVNAACGRKGTLGCSRLSVIHLLGR